MRKLVAYFMLTKVGKNWVAEASPEVFKTTIDKSKRKQYVDVLHQVDFIHLADLLFKQYHSKPIGDLFSKLATADDIHKLDLEDIQSYTPRSNWDRYFSTVIECQDTYFRQKWNSLYDLRCKVAHNALVSRSDFEEITKITGELDAVLQRALDNIGNVRVSDEDREQVAENVAAALSAQYAELVNEWKELEQVLSELATDATTSTPVDIKFISALFDDGLIDMQTQLQLLEITRFRFQLIHDTSGAIDEAQVRQKIFEVKDLVKMLRFEPPRYWRDEIVNVLQALGGEATLQEIYEYIEIHSNKERTSNWKAIVRYNINRNSSDTETFKYGGIDKFRHVGPGRWALRKPEIT